MRIARWLERLAIAIACLLLGLYFDYVGELVCKGPPPPPAKAFLL